MKFRRKSSAAASVSRDSGAAVLAPRKHDDGEGVAERARAPALEVVYASYWAELVRYVRRTFGVGPPDPEDVVQAAFTHYAALAQPDLVGNPRAFLYRAARNFVIDQRRRALVRSRVAGEFTTVADTADSRDAERVLNGTERLHILEQTINSLTPKHRDALILHRIHELSYVDIAQRLGVSQTSAKRFVADAALACARALRSADGES